jgi:SWI/SNF-related matrix-associated actin-dependent regulator of chromatin subfamily A-like protein 1
MTKLYPFQREAISLIYGFRGRALLADEQGLGKTVTTLYWIHRLPRRRPVIIVCPASMKYAWQAEARFHFKLHTEVIEGRRPSRVRNLPGDIVILNYDIVHDWMPVLLRAQAEIIVIDEIQYIKNPESRRSRCVKRLARRAASVLGLSGTPLTNHPIDLWAVLNTIRPKIFPERLTYAWRYCEPRYTKWGMKYDGAAHLGELHRILREQVMIRRRKKEVAPELPPKIHKVIPVHLSKDDMADYKQAEDDFVTWLSAKHPQHLAKALKAKAVVRVGYLLRLCSQMKMGWLIKWLEEYAETHPEGKLVGMTMHTAVIETLLKHFPNSLAVYGKVRGLDRAKAVRKFQTNSRTQFLWGNWRAAGVGITLHASNVLAALDFPWTPGQLLQGQDRIHRIGQKRKVYIYYPLVMGSIEERMMYALRQKTRVLESVLDGRPISKDFDIFDVILEEMRNE